MNKFNYFLNKIADPSFNISEENGVYVVSKNHEMDETSLENRIKNIVSYIGSYTPIFTNQEIKLIKTVHSKIFVESKKQSQEIQITLQPYLNKLESFYIALPTTIAAKKNEEPSISLQIAPPPTNKEEFISNLKLILEHYQRYQLHNDLSVFDSSFQSVPKGWNFGQMHQNLLSEFQKYEALRNDIVTNFSQLKNDFINLLKVPKPIKVGLIIETCPKNTDNTYLLKKFIQNISNGIPCIVNRQFFKAQTSNFKNHTEINLPKDTDIYVQEKGDLCVVIPKSKSLKELGFNSHYLKLSDENHLLATKSPLPPSEELKSLFINENDSERFYRLIDFQGHGLYPCDKKKENSELNTKFPGEIAGLPLDEFKKTLTTLKDANTAFMILGSCYAGGTNSTSIQLSDGTLPFPIYLTSSFEYPISTNLTYKEYDSSKVLTEAQKIIFPSSSPNAPLKLFPLQLKSTDREKLAQSIEYPVLAHKFSNLGTLFLPANREDVPKVAYTLGNSAEILDITRAFKNAKAHIKDTDANGLVDKQLNRKAYLFSDPIVPFSITSSSQFPMILLSRGGPTHHVIKEIVARHQNIEDIAKETFNAFFHVAPFPEPATKVFYIGQLKCRYNGKEVDLQKVMIKSTMKAKEISFQIKGETHFKKLCFEIGDSKLYPWRLKNTQTVDRYEALAEIYKTIAESAPSQNSLLQTTAGRESQSDFVEELNKTFFSKKMPGSAKLYSAILLDMFESSDNFYHVKKGLKELKQRSFLISRDEFLDIVADGIDMAKRLNLKPLQQIINECSYTPLMLAIKEGNIEKVKSMVQKHPNCLNEIDAIGSKPLTIAIREKKQEIARWLIEQGADVKGLNDMKFTPFYYACLYLDDLKFLIWILETKEGFKNYLGAQVLTDMITAKKWTICRCLIDHLVGSKADQKNFPLLAIAVDNNAEVEIVQKILAYPNVAINQTLNTNDETSLHRAVRNHNSKIVRFLLDHNADPNQGNKNKLTPLHYAAIYTDPRSIEIARDLIDNGANINCQDSKGRTPLHFAVKYKNKALIEFLIRHGASLQVEDINKANPLEDAWQNSDIFEFILQISGIDVNPKLCKLDKLYQKAILNGDLKKANLLRMHGISINQSFEKGEPPLLHYLRNKPKDADPLPVIQFFLNNGADLNLQDSEGSSVMHWVIENQELKIFKLLKDSKISYDKPIDKQGNTPFMLGFSKTPDCRFFGELLNENNLLNRDVDLILKNSMEKWGKNSIAGVLFLLFEITDRLLKEPKYISDPQLKLFRSLISTGLVVLSKDNEKIKTLAQHMKQWILWFKNQGIKPLPFYNLPLLHTVFYLGLGQDDATREIVLLFLEEFPDCIKEKYLELPTKLTRDVSILKTLIIKDAEIGTDPRFNSCDVQLIKLLEAKGIDFSGEIGLHYLKLFLSKDYKSFDKQEGVIYLLSKIKESPHAALSYAIHEEASDDLIDLLMLHPFMNFQNADDAYSSPLYEAIEQVNFSLIKRLLVKKAVYKPSRDISKDNFSNPLYLISFETWIDPLKRLEIVKLLINSDYKNKINEPCRKGLCAGTTPLLAAISSHLEPLALYFIQEGADVNYADNNGNTALHILLFSNVLGMNEEKIISLASLLIEKGARWDVANKEGIIPKELAQKLRLSKVLELMK